MLQLRKYAGPVAAIAMLLATVVTVSPVAAHAQAEGCASATTSVATEAELVAVINCHAAQTPAGTHNTLLTQDIELTALLPSIGGDSSFNIYGLGHRLVVPTALGDSRAFAILEAGLLTVTDLEIDMSANPTSEAIVVDGGGFFALDDSAIVNSAVGARIASGRLDITNSTFHGNGQGVLQTGGIATFVSATVTGVAGVGDGLRQTGGSALVVNSTFSALSTAIDVASTTATVRLQSSTIANNNVGLQGSGEVAAGSSVVADNTTDCLGVVTNAVDHNFDGDGSCAFATIDASALGALADNGCTTHTPIGCVKTHALTALGPWINGGDCRDALDDGMTLNTFFLTGLISDQRGFEREVAGRCDAGAFESDLVPMGALCDGLTVTINMLDGASGVGTSGDDVIVGTAGNDLIDAGDGNDTVCAGAGNDVVLVGNGNDTVFGEAGRDIVRGGPGIDVIEGGDGDDRLLGGIGDDTISGGLGSDYIGGFGGDDTIYGDVGNETIYGGFGADNIDGGPGDDVIRGLIGDDFIFGSAGDDTLDGDRGNDLIDGGPGNDVIRGGNANDYLLGGPGDDNVSGGKADDSLSGGLDADICIGNLQTVADTADDTCETILGVP